MKSFTMIIFCMFLAAAVAFAQGSMQQPGQMPQQPGTATPSQPSTMPAPSQQPGQSQPGAQMPQTQPQQAPQAAGAPAIDDQVKILSTELNLNSDQQTKVKSILQDQHTQAMALVSDSSLSRDDKIQKIHALRQATIDKVRSTLTSDDQKKKFDSMVQAQDERIRERQQGTTPEPQGTNPQSPSTSPQSPSTPPTSTNPRPPK
jgi:hypothetical protein